MESMAVLFVGLGVLWLGQLAMAWRQAKSFMRTTGELRKQGRVAIGMGRRRPMRRAYVALVADDAGRVTAANALSGLTVFARPRRLRDLDGASVADVAAGHVRTTLPPLLAAAARQAAGFLASQSASPGKPTESPAEQPSPAPGKAAEPAPTSP